MSVVFAANLLPGLARERWDAGVRCGFGRMNGRLAQYRYDRSSNRQWRRDAAAHAAGVTTEDQWYEYDGLYQVGEFQRGTLSGSYPNFSGITSLVQNQDWNYDAMGNWLGFQNDALNQTRQFNKVNEITSINGPSGVVTPQYDPVGNMTSMPAVSNWTTAQTLKWDAWNRLVRVTEGSTTIAEYSYDALFRRVTKTVSGTTRRFYYSDQWQILEEYLGSAVNPEMRYWYGLRDINDIARRQHYSSGTTLQNDLYALREIMNIVAIVYASGAVQQRMAYDAFGNTRFMDSAFAAGSNADDWNLLFHAHYRDAETGLNQIRFRCYHPILGAWLSSDPLLEIAGANLHRYLRNNPVNFVDYYGQIETTTTLADSPRGAMPDLPQGLAHRGIVKAVNFLGVLVILEDLSKCLNGLSSLEEPECFCTKIQQEEWVRESIELYKSGSEKCVTAAIGALTFTYKKMPGLGSLIARLTERFWKIAADFQTDQFVIDTFLSPLPPVDAHCGKRACYRRTPPWSDRYKPESDPWDPNARWWNPYDQSWHHWSEGPPGPSSGPPSDRPGSW